MRVGQCSLLLELLNRGNVLVLEMVDTRVDARVNVNDQKVKEDLALENENVLILVDDHVLVVIGDRVHVVIDDLDPETETIL